MDSEVCFWNGCSGEGVLPSGSSFRRTPRACANATVDLEVAPAYSLVGNIGDTRGFKKGSDQTWHLLNRGQLHPDSLTQLFAFT